MDRLPRELVIRIFSLLSLQDKVSLTTVSQSWRLLALRELYHVKGIKADSSGCKFSDHRSERFSAPDISSWSQVLTVCPNIRFLSLDSSLLVMSEEILDLITEKIGQTIECLTWRDVVLRTALRLPNLKHLTCKVVSHECLSSLLNSLQCLSCRGTTFTKWHDLPLGFKQLDASSYTHVDLELLLRSQAMQTITSLCVFCNEIPEALDYDPILHELQILKIHSRYPARVNQQQLQVIQSMISHSNLMQLSLCVTKPENLSDEFLDQFFHSFKNLTCISLWSGWRMGHQREIEILVNNCQMLKKADIYFSSLTDEGLETISCLRHLEELSMRRSLTLVTTTAFLRFICLLFSRSLSFLWFGGPLTFSVEDQDELIRIRNAYELKIDFKKSFEEPSEDDFYRTATPAQMKVEHIRIRKNVSSSEPVSHVSFS